MNDKLTDQDVISLYKQGATEKPSKILDAKILKLAEEKENKSHLELVSNKPIQKRHFYQTWYGQISTAASFLLVGVLYFQNNDSFNEPHQNSQFFDAEIMLQNKSTLSSSAVSPKVEKSRLKEMKNMPEKRMHTLKFNSVDELERGNTPTLKEFDVVNAGKIDSEFKAIKKLLIQGNRKEAEQVLNYLLIEYPTLKNELKEHYNKLTRELNVDVQ